MTTARQAAEPDTGRDLGISELRREAQVFVRQYIDEKGHEPTGAVVGARFGMKERWGRNQITAVREMPGGTTSARRSVSSGTRRGTAATDAAAPSGTASGTAATAGAARGGTVSGTAATADAARGGTASGTAATADAARSGTGGPAVAVVVQPGTAQPAMHRPAQPSTPPARSGTPSRTPSGPASDTSGTATGTAPAPPQRRTVGQVLGLLPLLAIGAGAFVSIWGGWVGLGELTGFGEIELLPGIVPGWKFNTAITLPLGMEAYAAYALRVWLAPPPDLPPAGRTFARRSAIGALILGAAGQIAYHLMAAAEVEHAPWLITAFVACLPVGVLGCAAALMHLVRHTERARS